MTKRHIQAIAASWTVTACLMGLAIWRDVHSWSLGAIMFALSILIPFVILNP